MRRLWPWAGWPSCLAQLPSDSESRLGNTTCCPRPLAPGKFEGLTLPFFLPLAESSSSW